MRATINGFRIAIVALVGYWIMLFIGTHVPPNQLISQLRVNDKLVHGCAFVGLAFLMAWAVPTIKTRLYQNTCLAALITVIYAGLDEVLQIPVGRTADWKDFAADCVGIFVGLACYSIARAILIRTRWNLFSDAVQAKKV